MDFQRRCSPKKPHPFSSSSPVFWWANCPTFKQFVPQDRTAVLEGFRCTHNHCIHTTFVYTQPLCKHNPCIRTTIVYTQPLHTQPLYTCIHNPQPLYTRNHCTHTTIAHTTIVNTQPLSSGVGNISLRFFHRRIARCLPSPHRLRTTASSPSDR